MKRKKGKRIIYQNKVLVDSIPKECPIRVVGGIGKVGEEEENGIIYLEKEPNHIIQYFFPPAKRVEVHYSDPCLNFETYTRGRSLILWMCEEKAKKMALFHIMKK